MIHYCYSVYDSKADAFLLPFSTRTRGVAIRHFVESCNDPGHMFTRHLADFTLFELGSFEDCDATYVLHPAPVVCMTGVEAGRLGKYDEETIAAGADGKR